MRGMTRTLFFGAAAGALLLGGQALAQTAAMDNSASMAAAQTLQPGMAEINLDDLDDMDVISAEGAEIGEIDDLIRRNGEVMAVLEVDDGWFSWNDQEVLVPLHMFERTEQGLRLPLSEQQAKQLQEYSRMDGDDRIDDDQGTLADAFASIE